MERGGVYRSSGRRSRYEDVEGDGVPPGLPLLDLAFGGSASGSVLPPLGSARSSRGPSEHRRDSSRWDREAPLQPRTARAEGDGREQALMRSAASWHAGNGSSGGGAGAGGGRDCDYDDPSLVPVQEDDGPALMEATDPELFHAGVVEHARRLGMDPEVDRDLLWVARDSLVAPVPSGWFHVAATDADPPYYYNGVTGESRWDHPCDDAYRQMYQQLRQQRKPRYDPPYRPQAAYTASGTYQTSAWGEEEQTQPPDLGGAHQTAYASGYGDQSWASDGYYEGYDAAPAASAYQPTKLLAADSGGANGYAPTSARAIPDGESPRGEASVSPYDPQQVGHLPPVKSEEQQAPEVANLAHSSSSDEAIAALKVQVATLASQLAARDQALEMSRADSAALQKTVHRQSSQLEASDKETQSIAKAKQAVETELSTMRALLEQRTHSDHGESSVLKIELAQEQSVRRDLTVQLDRAREEHAASEKRIADFQATVAQLERALATQQHSSKEADEQAAATSAAAVHSLQVDRDNKDREARAAQAQVHALKQEIEELKAAYSKALDSAQQTEDQAKEVNDGLASSRREVSSLNEQLRAAQSEIAATKKHMEEQAALQAAQLGEAEDQQRALKREVRSHEREMKALQTSLKEKEQEMAQLKTRCERAEAQLDEHAQAIEAARRQGYQEAQRANAETLRQLQEEKTRMAELYTQEMLTRRKLHNKLMELQGNIRVFCRVRPIQPVEEKSEQCAPAVFFKENDRESLELVVGGADANGDKASSIGQKYAFEFDHVFQPASSQDEVFEQTRALVVSALDGFNVCIFAYGQTGSGKTHTMEGPPSDRGVNYRALRELFMIRDARMASGNFECTMKLSILEVYNETVVDLLDSSASNTGNSNGNGNTPVKGLDIRIGKTGVYVDNLIEVEVHNESDVLDLMKLGHSHRSVGAHDFNEHSSRSHLVLSITIEAGTTSAAGSKADPSQSQPAPPRRRASKLHLIDLAGSERVSKTAASGQRLKEAQNINRSLSALGDVIAALGSNSKHVPYRNSKLTFLLQDSISGSSKVLMFVNVSPVQWNAWETLCSLNFAARCRNVALGQAKANSAASPSPASSTNGMQSAASTSSMSPAAARPSPMSVPKSLAQHRQAQS